MILMASGTGHLVSGHFSGQLMAGLSRQALQLGGLVLQQSGVESIRFAFEDSGSHLCSSTVWALADVGEDATRRLTRESETDPTGVSPP